MTGHTAPAETWNPLDVLRDVFGPDLAEATDLEQTDANAAFQTFLTEDTHPATAGAFLVANQWKPNTAGELAGYLDATMEASVVSSGPILDPVSAPAYGGVRETALLGVGAGIVAGAAGTPVAMHGGASPSDRVGNEELLAELGVTVDRPAEEAAKMVDECWVGYYRRDAFNPQIAAMSEVRGAVGVPTPLDVIDRSVNPAESRVLLTPVPETVQPSRLVETCKRSTAVEFDRILCFTGADGYDLATPTSSVVLWDAGTGDRRALDLQVDGIEFAADDLTVEDVPTESAAITEAVLEGDREGPFADAVLLNAALRIVAEGETESVAAGVDAARATIESGEAKATLNDLKEFRSAGTKSVDW